MRILPRDSCSPPIFLSQRSLCSPPPPPPLHSARRYATRGARNSRVPRISSPLLLLVTLTFADGEERNWRFLKTPTYVARARQNSRNDRSHARSRDLFAGLNLTILDYRCRGLDPRRFVEWNSRAIGSRFRHEGRWIATERERERNRERCWPD